MTIDYSAPAELFLAKPMKGSRTKYRRFATAAEAIRYAVEDLRTPKAFGAWLEVGDQRFNSVEIQRLYEDGKYPLRKSPSAARGLGTSLCDSHILGSLSPLSDRSLVRRVAMLYCIRMDVRVAHDLAPEQLDHRR